MVINKKRGFTIIELIVVIAIIAVLATIIVTSVAGYVKKAKIARAKADVANIEKALNLFYAQYGDYPYSLNASPSGKSCSMATPNCTTKFGNGSGEPYLTVSGVPHPLSEFYKSDWVGYNAKYYVNNGYYDVTLADNSGDGKIDCGIIRLYGDPSMNDYGTKWIICGTGCACGTAQWVSTGIFVN